MRTSRYRARSDGDDDMKRRRYHLEDLSYAKEMNGSGSSFLTPLLIHEEDTTGSGTPLSPLVIADDLRPRADDDVSEVLVIKDEGSDDDDDDLMFVESLEVQELLLPSMKPCAGGAASVDDPKGKRPEAHCTGSASTSGEERAKEFYCNICLETKPAAEGFDVPSCSHAFCASCMALYIAAKVEENVTSIGCPDPTCEDGAVHPEACRGILPEGVFHRWGAALCEQAVGARRLYCPHRDCSALLIDEPGEGEEVISSAECPHCHRMLCARCKVPWHDGIDCDGFQKLAEDERGAEDLMLRKLAISSKWQRCTQCKMFVERTQGCVFMTCRCGHCFCYLCASPMSTTSHYCQSCKRMN